MYEAAVATPSVTLQRTSEIADHLDDHRSVTDKLRDEALMLWGAKDSINDGVVAGVKDMYHHPMHVVEVAGVAAGIALAMKLPGGRYLGWGLTTAGIASLLGPDAVSVWKSHQALEEAQRDLGMKTGETLAYMPVGMLGYGLGNEVSNINWRALYTNAQINDGLPAAQPIAEAAEGPLKLDSQGAVDYFKQNMSDMIEAKKQLYNVNFKKVTPEMYTEPEGMRVPTLETPEGVLVKDTHWIATRLNPDGTPNIENGLVNQWPVTPKTILKTYQVMPEQLDATSMLTAPTRVDAPPVHMVPLQQPTELETPWGTMSGQKGGWLANYGFDAMKQQPGNDFAIVTGKSFSETYEPANPTSKSIFDRIMGIK